MEQNNNQNNHLTTIEETSPWHTLEHAYEEMGGFGRFQWFSTIMLVIARNSGNFMYYGFAYLTMEQMYLCRFDPSMPFESCSAKEVICPALSSGNEQLEYEVDESYEYYLDNWFVQMNLICTPKVKVSLMISYLYMALGVAGLLLFAMPDRFGRKFTMVTNLTVHVAAQYIILFSSTLGMRSFGLILFGCAQLKQTVSYVWATELAPAAKSTVITVSLTCFNSGSLAFICAYFLLISRDWFPLMLFMTVLSTIAYLACVFVLPESPFWLFTHGRKRDAIDVLNYIGKLNGASHKIEYSVNFVEAKNQDN